MLSNNSEVDQSIGEKILVLIFLNGLHHEVENFCKLMKWDKMKILDEFKGGLITFVRDKPCPINELV